MFPFLICASFLTSGLHRYSSCLEHSGGMSTGTFFPRWKKLPGVSILNKSGHPYHPQKKLKHLALGILVPDVKPILSYCTLIVATDKGTLECCIFFIFISFFNLLFYMYFISLVRSTWHYKLINVQLENLLCRTSVITPVNDYAYNHIQKLCLIKCTQIVNTGLRYKSLAPMVITQEVELFPQ